MTKWMMGALAVLVVGCTESRELAQPSKNEQGVELAVKTELDLACDALSETLDALIASDTDNRVETDRVYGYLEAYCSEPTADYGVNLYCRMVANHASDECRTSAAPFLSCLADNPTPDPAVACADENLTGECAREPDDSEATSAAASSGAEGGLLQSCLGAGISGEMGVSTDVIEVLAPAQGSCADGHRYAVRCVQALTCSVECSCSVDGAVVKTVPVTGLSSDMGVLFEACGWTA